MESTWHMRSPKIIFRGHTAVLNRRVLCPPNECATVWGRLQGTPWLCYWPRAPLPHRRAVAHDRHGFSRAGTGQPLYTTEQGAGKSSSLAYPAKLNSDALWLGLGQNKMTKMWVLPQLVTSTKENSHFTKQPTSSNSIILLLKHIITEISEMPRIWKYKYLCPCEMTCQVYSKHCWFGSSLSLWYSVL